jgi:hypothetical protein
MEWGTKWDLEFRDLMEEGYDQAVMQRVAEIEIDLERIRERLREIRRLREIERQKGDAGGMVG